MAFHQLSLKLDPDKSKQMLMLDKKPYNLFVKIEQGQIILTPYHKSTLGHILRYHRDSLIFDQGEHEIRKSFDILLDFFGKLGYLLKVGLIKKDEITYFAYYINKILENQDVLKYIENYKFDLFAVLLNELGILPESLRNLLPMSETNHSS